MYLIRKRNENEILIQTYKQVYEIFTDEDIEYFKMHNIKITREPLDGITTISFNLNMENLVLAEIIKRTLKD